MLKICFNKRFALKEQKILGFLGLAPAGGRFYGQYIFTAAAMKGSYETTPKWHIFLVIRLAAAIA